MYVEREEGRNVNDGHMLTAQLFVQEMREQEMQEPGTPCF